MTSLPPTVALPASWTLPAVRCFSSNGSVPDPKRPLNVAIGMFDGVHLGHQAVIESAVAHARRIGGHAGVFTFDPHPSRLFRPEQPTRLLQPPGLKVRELFKQGVELVLLKTFEPEFAALPEDAFLPLLKKTLPTLRSIHVGENFRFGKGRSGDISALVESGKALGLDVFSVDRIRYNGEPVSSSRLRAALREGAIESVNTMLGYNYYALGEVQSGQQLGRQLGFPTLNLDWTPELAPRYGVYAVRVQDDSGDWKVGVANYGVRPTVAQDSPPVLEVHVLEAGAGCWGPGTRLRVEWCGFIRGEKQFASIDALKEQIAADCEAARGWFESESR